MSVAVIMPYGGGDEPRAQAFSIVFSHLVGLPFPVEVILCSSVSAARNRGAENADAKILVFNDADTLVPHPQILEAVKLAKKEPGLVFAFTDYNRLDRETTEAVYTPADAFAASVDQSFPSPPSHGCVAIRRSCFDEVGGYDERLEAFEDCAFTLMAEKRWPSRRVDGPAVHLWHPRLGDVGDKAWEDRFAESRRIWEREYLGG